MNLLLIIILLCGPWTSLQATAPSRQIVTAAQVNGTWESKFGIFKILALGRGRLRVEFSGVYEYKLSDGSPMANTGEGHGIATIEGRKAKFKPEGAEEECLITLEFIGSGMVVRQEGVCGFGNSVTAVGKYRRVKAGKPKFEESGAAATAPPNKALQPTRTSKSFSLV